MFQQHYFSNPPICLPISHYSQRTHLNFSEYLDRRKLSLHFADWLGTDGCHQLCVTSAQKSQQLYSASRSLWYEYFNTSKVINASCRISAFKYPFRTNFIDVFKANLSTRDLYYPETALLHGAHTQINDPFPIT